MNEISTNTVKKYEKNEENGKKILKKNKFFQDFTSLMRNIEFRDFYQNYFKDWSDIQTMIFYMKIYSTVEEIYYTKYNQNISDELMTYVLHQIITKINQFMTMLLPLTSSSAMRFCKRSIISSLTAFPFEFAHDRPPAPFFSGDGVSASSRVLRLVAPLPSLLASSCCALNSSPWTLFTSRSD